MDFAPTLSAVATEDHAIDPADAEFYRRTMVVLEEAAIPFLVGGAYAFAGYTGIVRHTKDFDLFLRQGDLEPALASLAAAGFDAELTFPHWLGKVRCGDAFVDLIYGSGNGLAEVDDQWFEHAVPGEVLGLPVKLCPAEEIIWSKSFVLERERYDGADVAHLLRSRARELDWKRLLRRFGSNFRVLLSHLILFGYIYPAERQAVPQEVMDALLSRLVGEGPAGPAEERICRGTILSRSQYLTDVLEWGYHDARLAPIGAMSAADIRSWTEAGREEERRRREQSAPPGPADR
ncbi:MAG TPA: hypothetical protein VOA87_20760 [Thermoanaerobaculia bacterium]|nr:hypothetical protein [Thermoanaerobaculia bacterium]